MPDIHPYITENQTLNINEIGNYVNDVTSGAFFPLILLAMFAITFVTTMHFGTGRAFVFSSFFSSIIAIFMVVGGLLSPMYMYLLFVFLAISILIVTLGGSSNAQQI